MANLLTFLRSALDWPWTGATCVAFVSRDFKRMDQACVACVTVNLSNTIEKSSSSFPRSSQPPPPFRPVLSHKICLPDRIFFLRLARHYHNDLTNRSASKEPSARNAWRLAVPASYIRGSATTQRSANARALLKAMMTDPHAVSDLSLSLNMFASRPGPSSAPPRCYQGLA